MIRHGQASFGSENYDRLSPRGVVQAGIVANHLLKTGVRFDAVYTGCMKRQEKTAEALIDVYREQGLPMFELIKAEAFSEYDAKSVFNYQMPMMIAADPSLSKDVKMIYSDEQVFQRLFQQVMTRWASGKHDPPDSPRWQEFRDRVQQGVREVMKRHSSKKSLAVFTSGGPISAAVQMALELTDEKAMMVSWQIMNASITRFKYNSKSFALAGFNDISHLKLEGDKDILTYR
jgi:broad specificity phosphatase PhoE